MSRKEGIGKGRIGNDAAAQELSLIKAALSQAVQDASSSEDADLALAKKLQAEEFQRNRAVSNAPKKKAASTLDRFFKRQKS